MNYFNYFIQNFTISLLLLLSSTNEANAQWMYFQEEGTNFVYATTQPSTSLTPMSPPFHDTSARLAIACLNDDYYAYILFTKTPSIIGAENSEFGYTFNTKIHIDDTSMDWTFTQPFDSNQLLFMNPTELIRKLINTEVLLLNINWRGNGFAMFMFTVDEFSSMLFHLDRFCNT